MKTYKLIKNYPGAVMPLEVTEKIDGNYECSYNYTEFTNNIVENYYDYSAKMVENNPEYWEEIKPIPKFVTSDGVEIFNEIQYMLWYSNAVKNNLI